jgi:hypothetical protein
MVTVIDPKVEFAGYGPFLGLGNGERIIPDELVYGAAGITFKGMSALDELRETREQGNNVDKKMTRSIIKSAGAGHASMSTTPGFWFIMEGNCSKMVDSIFTGAKYSSSLMPSGRRVGIDVDQVVVPRNIHENPEAERLYMDASILNIKTYEELMKRGVEKQQASKIVQYGHSGGGFMFMPLETLVYFSKLLESTGCEMPLEGREIISQMEDFVHEHGMGVVYEARRNAPRTGCPSPDIFHSRRNWASELMQQHQGRVDPILIAMHDDGSRERDDRLLLYHDAREFAFGDQGRIKSGWRELLKELEDIVQDYNESVSVTTLANSPWRVWGEVKRHRTLNQSAESIYMTAKRAMDVVDDYANDDITEEHLVGQFLPVVSIPKSVSGDRDNLQMWLGAFSESMRAYGAMTSMGIPESDAISVIPRGLKLGIVKKYDLYNMLSGYLPLRLCGTCEPEMRETSEKERVLITNSSMSRVVKQLIGPKCNAGGFCPEPDYKRCCGKVRNVVPGYDEEFHSSIQGMREQEIMGELEE